MPVPIIKPTASIERRGFLPRRTAGCGVIFYPLIQPKNTLSGDQKYLLRLIYGWAGKTILHKGRLVEIIETHDEIRRLSPLMESDLSEGDGETDAFWSPSSSALGKRFNLERRDRSRARKTIGIVSGDSRPKGARRQALRSNFPPAAYLHRMVADMGYEPEAASAGFARAHIPWARPTPDRRKASALNMDEQDEGRNHAYASLAQPSHPYNPASPSRRTRTGGGHTEEQVRKGMQKMRTDETTKTALLEIVYRGRSTLQVADEYGLRVGNLYVYASRLRSHIQADVEADVEADLRAA